MFRKNIIFTLSLAALWSFSPCYALEEAAAEEAAIRRQTDAYVQAFNRRDAEALAALWTEDAAYIDSETGATLQGRQQIENYFRQAFQERDGSRLALVVTEISFPAVNQAVETGTATMQAPGEEELKTAYRAFYEKRNGNWLLTQVREAAFDSPPTQYEHLKDLEWLIGEWVDQGEDSSVETKVVWDKYKNFLIQNFKVFVEGQFALEGRQVIGWDPIKEQIRSWVFDSDGAFGEGTWKKEEGAWVVETAQTLADGSRASSINIYKPLDNNKYSWESKGREAGGVLLPAIEPITVERKR